MEEWQNPCCLFVTALPMDLYQLSRFTKAQEHTYQQALREIKEGKKRSHWMWFVFPQIKGLGFSETSKFYSIKSLAEARAYLADALLGFRLREISEALLQNTGENATTIFGHPDDLKLHSSMTLFAKVNEAKPNVFEQILDKFFKGKPDEKTLAQLA